MEKQFKTVLAEKSDRRSINWKLALMLAIVAFVALSPTFAVSAESSGIDALDSFSEQFLAIFTSSWVEIVCIIALIIIGILAVAGFQNGGGIQVFKTFVPWAIGVIIIMSASAITDFFWEGVK